MPRIRWIFRVLKFRKLWTGKKIAVIGSGPAGLTVAYDLRLLGYQVSVFEAADKPGGMLRYGIPDYRLPQDVLDAEIGYIRRMGVDIRTGRKLGIDFSLADLKDDGFASVFSELGLSGCCP
ncbi:MAG: NAD(P)-binding protein [Desulfobacterales bacterium]